MPMLAPLMMTTLFLRPRSMASDYASLFLRFGRPFLEGTHELGAGLIRHAGRFAAVPDADDLRQDADRDLGRRAGADVDTDGRADLLDVLQRDAFVLQQLEDGE